MYASHNIDWRKIVAGSAQVLTIGWLRSDFRLARIFVRLLGCSASLAVGNVL